jgi:hypothetical protein
MTTDQQRVRRKQIMTEIGVLLIILAVVAVVMWVGIACANCREKTRRLLIMFSMTALLWIVLWKGNVVLNEYLSGRISWIKLPVKRFITGVAATLVFTVVVVGVSGFMFRNFFSVDLSSTLTASLIITLSISLFMHGRSFLLNWRQAAMEAKNYQTESIAAKYESLKNQVNPHFLFNSLNALTNLVYDDPDKAARFINQLSEVYRYVLDTKDQEVVPLERELEFLNAYLYLQQIRFGDKLSVSIGRTSAGIYVAPLALQMLIENAIKHNVVSEEDPLNITIAVDNQYIIVKNNLQPRIGFIEPSAGVGLENICRRYEFLTKDQLRIVKSENYFEVSVPLLGATSPIFQKRQH